MENPAQVIKRLTQHLMRLDNAIKTWRLRRFTPNGQLVLLGLVISAALGMDTNRTMAYQGFTFLLSLLAVAVLSCLLHRIRLTVRRTLPRFGTVGEPLVYRLMARNETGKVQNDLFVMENPSKLRYLSQELSSGRALAAMNRGRSHRASNLYREGDLTLGKRGVKASFYPLPAVPPRSEVEVRLEILPPRRGRLHFGAITLARPDPFGLVRSLIEHSCKDSVLILPKRYSIPDVALPGNRKYHRGGVALTSSVGESQEFMSLRDYRAGDPLRHLHWKSLAKVDKPIVKEYQEEFFVRHALVLDTFAADGDAELFEEAVSVAASLACTVSTQESLLDLMFVAAQTYCFTAGRSLATTERMLEILASVEPCRDKSFAVLKNSVLERAALLSGCICVLLGWDEPRKEFIRALDALGLPRLVLVISSAAALAGEHLEPATEREPFFHRLEVGSIQQGLLRL
jgi:uncharacterized protein (DUF58 family)